MDSLLFLAHRLPYPPNKGDKVRSYHFLRHLATRYRVHVGTFIDDPADHAHVPDLAAMCEELRVEPLDPRAQRARSASGFVTGEALTLPYFRSRNLAQWVRATVARTRPRLAFAFSAPMAQYLIDLPAPPCVIDFVDVDSAKWSEYARRRAWPLSAVYRREGRRLLAFEKEASRRAAASIFVTESEAALFRRLCGTEDRRVAAIANCVDSEYFSPTPGRASPYAPGVRPIVFTGAMDYWPNVDAVTWFAREVLPAVLRNDPRAKFYVVGMNPDPAVRALAGQPAIEVTGRVPDVRPYLQHAAVVVAPLRLARGIQNKVLEGMSMARPVVVSEAAASGLAGQAGRVWEQAADAGEFAGKVSALLAGGNGERLGDAARAHVLRMYTWDASSARLDELLDRVAAGSASSLDQPAPAVRPAPSTIVNAQ